jgi:Phage phiEco32-like COOH.NH2 ligase-type 2
MQFLIGADPECFIRNRYTGNYTSIVGKLGGTKQKPLPIDTQGHCVQEDNVAVEFNVPPASDAVGLAASIHKVLGWLREKLPDYELDRASAVSFPKEELDTPEAQMFGCEPDFNAWKMCENPKPRAPDPNLRSCGGHIHISSKGAIERPTEMIRAMDVFAGLPAVFLDKGILRKSLYGKAGAFRFKDYGVEYRTLSNFWIFSDELVNWAYNATKQAVDFIEVGHSINEADGKSICRAINTNNEKLALKFMEKYGVQRPF